ncbi:MAG: orotate phosphoribosyltransferase [Nitrospinae bacterium]|nr:orotate phosphoribosyltransferase [Nitrospinota bacterium]
MVNDDRQELLAAIRTKAYRKGDFTLSSGLKSDYYIDMKEVTLDPEGSLLVGRVIFETVRGWGANAVGGMELGSVPISTAVSLVSAMEGAPLFNIIVRKEPKGHGTGRKIEGKIAAGTNVVVVEDVVSTGGSSLKAIDVILEAGARIAGVVSIVDRNMGGVEAFKAKGVRYEPLFTINEVKG